MSRTKVLVTGGSGYFGSILSHRLREKHDCRIFDIVYPENSVFEFVSGDIRDLDAVKRACKGIKVVYHNVAQVPLAKNSKLFQSVNAKGTENILIAAATEGVEKVVYTSSSAIFGVPKSNPVNEETAPDPVEDYGRAKLSGEHHCMEFSRRGLDISIIRPRTILGKGRQGIFQLLFKWIRQGYNIPVFGCGNNVYQFVHADDLATACILAANRKGFSIYNCGADRFGTMRELLEGLCEYAGTLSKVRGIPEAMVVSVIRLANFFNLSPIAPYHLLMYGRSIYFDTSKAKKELGWMPIYSNDEMIRESYDWYINNANAEDSNRSPHRSAVKEGALNVLKRLI